MIFNYRSAKRCALFLFISLLLILPLSAVAAEGGAAGDLYNDWGYLLNGDNVYDIAVSGGYLWQGTGGGLILRNLSVPRLYRHFQQLNSGLNGSKVYAVAPDGKGGVWLGTEKGASYRSPNGGWVHYDAANSPLKGNAVQTIHLDGQGGIWFGTWLGGAYYLGPDRQWQVFNSGNSSLPGNNIYAITTDGQGGVWFGVDGRGAAYLSAGGKWRLINAANSDLPVNDVLDIAVDAEGSVWFATYNGLACLKGDGKWTVYSAGSSKLPAGPVSALAPAKDGSIWLAAGSGLAHLAGGEIKDVYTKENSKLSGDVIKSLGIDEQDRIWAGTWGGGVACLNLAEGTWIVCNHETMVIPGGVALPSNAVNTVLPVGAEGEATVWFGTDRGAAKLSLKEGAWKSFPLAAKSGGEPAQVRQISLSPDGKRLALALDGSGLAVMGRDGGAGQRYYEESSGLPSDAVVDAAFDAEGGLWVATMGGGAAHLSTAGKWTVYDMANSEISSDYLNCVFFQPGGGGKVWFGTWEGGACAYDIAAKTWQVYNIANSSLPLNDVRCLTADSDGSIWFGTWGAGLAKLGSDGKWKLYDSKNGLPSNIIRSLAQDAAGRIWVATPAGAATLSGDTWKAFCSGGAGLPADDLRQVTGDRSGNIWFSTSESGVAVYNPEGLPAALRGLGGPAQKPEEILLYLGDKILAPDVPPLMQSGRVLVPLRIISESLGAEVNWDSGSGKIEVIIEGKKLELAVGNKKASLNGKRADLDVPPSFVSGRTMVPLRFIGESLDLDVHWDGVIRAVLLR